MLLFITDGCNKKNGKGKMGFSNYKILEKLLGVSEIFSVAIHTFGENDLSFFDYSYPFISKSRMQRGFAHLIGLFKNYPVHFDRKLLNHVDKIIHENNIEHVFIDASYMGNLSRIIKTQYPSIIVTTFFHDIVGELSYKWMLKKPLHTLPFVMNMIFNEKQAVKYSDNLITLNNRDTQLLYKIYRKKVSVEMPIILDDHYSFKEYKDEGYLLFVGVDHYPNVDGIRWFIKDVLPFIEDKNLVIVGRGMEKYRAEFESLCTKVSVQGTVDCLEKYYLNASLVVAPIFSGGGMKVKVAEALMYGKIVIGASEAFQGYDLTKFLGKEANKIGRAHV